MYFDSRGSAWKGDGGADCDCENQLILGSVRVSWPSRVSHPWRLFMGKTFNMNLINFSPLDEMGQVFAPPLHMGWW